MRIFKAVYSNDDVNITVDLLVICVWESHGTAFDIAGKKNQGKKPDSDEVVP